MEVFFLPKSTHYTNHVIVPELMSDSEILIAYWRQLTSCSRSAETGSATGAVAMQAAVTPGGWHRLAEIQGTRY